MRVELYKIMDSINRYFYWRYSELNIENISSYIKENTNEEFSNSELDAIMTYMNAEDKRGYIKEYTSNEYSNMKPEEVTENVFEFLNQGIFDVNIISSVKDISNLLDNIDNLDSKLGRWQLINSLDFNAVLEYINENGSKKDNIIELFSNINSIEVMDRVMNNLDSDSDRAKTLLLLDTNEKSFWLSLVETPYYRIQLVKQSSEYPFETSELIENNRKYDSIKAQFDKFETEEEKAEFVTTVDDYDMRLDFLSQIKSRENRNLIINSFENVIDPRIKSQVDLVQNMIREYFEDTLGDKFDDAKREKMELVFKKASVSFASLEVPVNGKAYHLWDEIAISDRHVNNINRTLGFLVHEYEHTFSRFDYKTTQTLTSKTIEEGTADLFSDLVINHYIEKHGEIELDGKKVRVDYPYMVYSGYDFENAWQRTILYGIRDDGKDNEALAEYVLGDKYKYLELVLGPEKAQQKAVNQFGIPDLETSYQEIYGSSQMDFSKTDTDSIYAKRNFILPMYELQNRLNEKQVNILDGKHYLATYIGEKYFDSRKLYDISREEMQEFTDLLVSQRHPNAQYSAVVDADEFYNSKINELTEDEIKENSFELLNTNLAMWGKRVSYGSKGESFFNIACKREIELVEEGQPLEDSIRKYKAIIPDYQNQINPKASDSNSFICDFISDLKFAYLEQIRESLENGKAEEVIAALTDKDTEEIYLDEDINEMFTKYNIQVSKKSGLKDVLEAGITMSQVSNATEFVKTEAARTAQEKGTNKPEEEFSK